MMGSTTATSADGHLDILGQLPSLNIYTQICLCYSLPNSTSQTQIINCLQNGLEKLSASFPWVAARVYNEGVSEGNTGVAMFKPLEKTPRLIIKDHTNEPSIPSIEIMTAADFPMTMLAESIIAPIPTIPSLEPDNEAAKDLPVFALQANFIKGGLLLTFVAEHRTMDGTGQGQILYLLSKACRGEEFTLEEIAAGNHPRTNLVPLFDPATYTPGPELSHQLFPQAPKTQEQKLPEPVLTELPPNLKWANFSFSPASLRSLKTLAMKSLPEGEFISTDDALTAFVWESITLARKTPKSSLARAVNIRHLFSLPATYPGMFQTMTYHTLPSEVNTALSLRKALTSTSTLISSFRSLSTHISQTPDKSIFSLTGSMDLKKDLMLASWVKQNSYELDFGMGIGTPVAVRRPKFAEVEGLGYLLPMDRDGGVVFAVCLREVNLESLKEMEGWNKFAKYVG